MVLRQGEEEGRVSSRQISVLFLFEKLRLLLSLQGQGVGLAHASPDTCWGV